MCRYDFFYKNGVPRWRGTGYYYSRFRPGLGVCIFNLYVPFITTKGLILQSVFVFLTIVTSGLQYIIQGMNYKRDLQRIEDIISRARSAAWGPKLVPVPGKRKVSSAPQRLLDSHPLKRLIVQVRVALGPGKDEDGNTDSKQLDMVVDGQDVFIVRGSSH